MGRPAPRFGDFIGHYDLIAPIRREMVGAIARNEPHTHMLFTGPSGVGKTKLARALAAERNTRLLMCMGYESTEEVSKKLTRLRPCDFLFVDEAHRLKPATQELLFVAIDRGRVPSPPAQTKTKTKPSPPTPGSNGIEPKKRAFINLQPFTLLLASDQPGLLLDAMRKRLPITLALTLYPLKEMREIVETIASEKQVLLSPQAARRIAEVSHGLPRKARDYLARLRLFFNSDGQRLSIGNVEEFLSENGIDYMGFGRQERKYLWRLGKLGSASLETLASFAGSDKDDVQRQLEPVLLRKGLIQIFSSGRKLTDKGKKLVAGWSTRSSTQQGGNE